MTSQRIRRERYRPKDSQRRGAALVFGVFLLTVIIGMMAFAVDLGYLGVARSELRRTADSAAISACWQLFDEKVLASDDHQVASQVRQSAEWMASQNIVCRAAPQLAPGDDLQLGHFQWSTGTFNASEPSEANAVRIRIQRTSALNGEVPLFFGRMVGINSRPLEVTATAAMVSSVSGFREPTDGKTLNMLPFALDEQTWEAMLAGSAEDSFAYDPETGSVVSGNDGAPEGNLFPQGTGSPGNRGTVNIGRSNNSTADLKRQILQGISAQDLIDLGKPLELGPDGTLELTGNPGISAAVKAELSTIVGEKRIIPIFSHVSGNGANATYTIVRFAGVRVLEVKLTGAMNQKRVMIQPANVLARSAVLDDSGAVTSDYLYAPVMLVQ